MELAFSEMPLALFTTLASVGAGSFVALAITLYSIEFDEEALKKLDKLTVAPLLFVVIGFALTGGVALETFVLAPALWGFRNTRRRWRVNG